MSRIHVEGNAQDAFWNWRRDPAHMIIIASRIGIPISARFNAAALSASRKSPCWLCASTNARTLRAFVISQCADTL